MWLPHARSWCNSRLIFNAPFLESPFTQGCMDFVVHVAFVVFLGVTIEHLIHFGG